MAVTQGLHFTNDGATAAEVREVTQHLWTRRRSGVLRTGSTADNSLLVTEKSGTPNMSVDVADGAAAVLGTEATAQGVYLVEAPTTTNVTIAAADPTNARKDLIVVRIKDQDYTSGSPSTNTTTIEAITGTPSGSPALPTIPDNCVLLAIVDVAALASSIVDANITDQRWTGYTNHNNQDNGSAVGHGGRSTGLSTALPQTAHAGHEHWQTDTDSAVTWTGTAWEGPGVWKAYTASHTNVTFSAETSRYCRIGDTIHVAFLGTVATATGGNMTLGLPVVPGGFYAGQIGYGQVYATDATASLRYSGVIEIQAGASIRIYRADDGGIASGSAWDTTANIPFAWAAGDLVHFTLTYEA